MKQNWRDSKNVGILLMACIPGVLLNWIAMPVFISWIITFILPKLTDKFLEKQKQNKDREDKILRANLKAEEENIKAKTGLLEAQIKELQLEKEKMRSELEAEMKEKALVWAREEMNKAESGPKNQQEDIWNEEYKEVEIAGIIPELVNFIFGKNGRRYNQNNDDNISTYYFATFITLGLIQEGQYNYELTEKGKFMIQKYPMNKLKEQLEPSDPF